MTNYVEILAYSLDIKLKIFFTENKNILSFFYHDIFFNVKANYFSLQKEFFFIVRDISTAITYFWGTDFITVLIFFVSCKVSKLWNSLCYKYP